MKLVIRSVLLLALGLSWLAYHSPLFDGLFSGHGWTVTNT